MDVYFIIFIYIIINFIFNQHNWHCAKITPGSTTIVIQKPATKYGYELPHQTPNLTSTLL